MCTGSIRIHSRCTWLAQNQWHRKQARGRISGSASARFGMHQKRTEWTTILGSHSGRMRWFAVKFLRQLFHLQLLSAGIFPFVWTKHHSSRIKGNVRMHSNQFCKWSVIRFDFTWCLHFTARGTETIAKHLFGVYERDHWIAVTDCHRINWSLYRRSHQRTVQTKSIECIDCAQVYAASKSTRSEQH